MGRKPSDEMVIPLFWKLHGEQHAAGCEVAFWLAHGKTIEQVKQLARDLYAVSGETELARDIITEFRNE